MTYIAPCGAKFDAALAAFIHDLRHRRLDRDPVPAFNPATYDREIAAGRKRATRPPVGAS